MKTEQVKEIVEKIRHVSIAVYGDFVYLGTYNSGILAIVDVSEPTNPSLAGFYFIGSTVGELTVFDSYLCVGTNAHPRFQILDISTPKNPRFTGGIDLISDASDIDIVGEHAYLCVPGTHFYILDISNVRNPKEAAHLVMDGAISAVISGRCAYVSADIEPQKPLKGLIQHVSYDSHPIVYYIITEYIPFDYDIDPPVTYRSTSPETFDPNNIQIDENLTPWEIYDS